MANENRPKISTGFLQPAKVDYKSLDEKLALQFQAQELSTVKKSLPDFQLVYT